MFSTARRRNVSSALYQNMLLWKANTFTHPFTPLCGPVDRGPEPYKANCTPRETLPLSHGRLRQLICFRTPCEFLITQARQSVSHPAPGCRPAATTCGDAACCSSLGAVVLRLRIICRSTYSTGGDLHLERPQSTRESGYLATRSFTTSKWPLAAAWCSEVEPPCEEGQVFRQTYRRNRRSVGSG